MEIGLDIDIYSDIGLDIYLYLYIYIYRVVKLIVNHPPQRDNVGLLLF